ncbi:hypothetical protein SEA_EURATIS_41 [Streptomyces phage Euratis]|uniref:Uncharacterized protein n=1 Tax=Streptomyces phage Euratis TaxID=2510569 RepID=A0A411B120_9CAUD|nr:hypothetical protein SEA_EURATIS_41 [Streptomyces phage Euratis]
MADLKAPRPTAAMKRAERTAERVDSWRIARNLLREDEVTWAEGITPYDVFQLAHWLAGADTNE